MKKKKKADLWLELLQFLNEDFNNVAIWSVSQITRTIFRVDDISSLIIKAFLFLGSAIALIPFHYS